MRVQSNIMYAFNQMFFFYTDYVIYKKKDSIRSIYLNNLKSTSQSVAMDDFVC